jgi:hypothetical protein
MASEKIVRKLTRSGSHSYYVLLPPEIIRDLKWKAHQKVTVEKQGKNVVIRDWKK